MVNLIQLKNFGKIKKFLLLDTQVLRVLGFVYL